MRTSTQLLEGNQVKLTVEVDEEEIRQVEDDTIRRLTREARLPGFRPGKVPRRLLEARLGPKVVREETLRDVLPRWYAEAVEESDLDVIAAPEIDITTGEESGPVAFDAVVEVRPLVTIAGYEGLLVTLPSPEPTPEEIDAQVDRLREQFAALTEVDRPAGDGDLVTLDVHGSRDGALVEGLAADDLVYEVGTGGIVAGIDELLHGATVGSALELDAEDAPGGPAQLKVAVKQVREKVLPAADDDFAADASEFATLAELRDDLAARLADVRRFQASYALRERALEALVELVDVEPPPVLVSEEAERLLGELVHRLSHQHATFEHFLETTGQTAEEALGELREQSVRQVKADLALRALAEAEEIEVDESEVDDEIVRLAEHDKQPPARLRSQLERDGRISGLRSQMRSAKALTWLVEHVGIVDEKGEPMDRSTLRPDSSDLSGSSASLASDGDTEEAASAVPGKA